MDVARAQDLEARSDGSIEDFWASLDHPNDRHVDRCLAEGKDWRIRAALQQTIAAASIRACTYPARPVNGGAPGRGPPKTRQWVDEAQKKSCAPPFALPSRGTILHSPVPVLYC